MSEVTPGRGGRIAVVMAARRRIRGIGSAACLVVTALLLADGFAYAGSTEPELAIARVTASVEDSVVTLQVTGNYDHGNVVRLGYPLDIVVTTSDAVARLALDGGVTVASGGNPPAAVPNARGVVAIAPDRLTAVLPPALTTAHAATVRLEATFEGAPLRSNAVGVSW